MNEKENILTKIPFFTKPCKTVFTVYLEPNLSIKIWKSYVIIAGALNKIIHASHKHNHKTYNLAVRTNWTTVVGIYNAKYNVCFRDTLPKIKCNTTACFLFQKLIKIFCLLSYSNKSNQIIKTISPRVFLITWGLFFPVSSVSFYGS